jgi:electron transfer flavoprotein alpha subunit
MNNDILVVVEHLQNQVLEITYTMLAAARDLAAETGGKVGAVVLGDTCSSLIGELAADYALCIQDPALAEFTSDAYQKALTAVIKEKEPLVVILGNTSIGSDIAGILSAKLNLPLIGSCHHFENGKFVSQTCGGKILVEGQIPDTTSILTLLPGGYKPEEGRGTSPESVEQIVPPPFDDLKVSLIQYHEPETGDVDIASEEILIAVGRGIQTEDNLELAEELAEAMGAAICASRPVVDQGWLPISRMVGKSGKAVKPKLYLAFGISGAPEHTEGITDSQTIIAINTDATAPIFDVADYGVNLDLFDFIEVLTETVEES